MSFSPASDLRTSVSASWALGLQEWVTMSGLKLDIFCDSPLDMLVKSLVLLAHLLEMRFIGPVWTEHTDHLAGSLLLGSSCEWLYKHTKPHSGSRSSLPVTVTRGLAAWSQRRLLPLTLLPGTVLGLVQPSRLEATPPSTLSANHPLFYQSSVFWLVDQLCFCSGCLPLKLGLGAHTSNPSSGRLRQEDHLSLRPARLMTEFQANLGCRVGFCLRTKSMSVWDGAIPFSSLKTAKVLLSGSIFF